MPNELGPTSRVVGRCGRTGAPAAAATRVHGILIADDEPLIREVLEDSLRDAGFSVWLAEDGGRALDLYRAKEPAIDVVLLDVRMPILDGPQTLLALRRLAPLIRCCFMSGDLGLYHRQDLFDLGACAIFSKPFRLVEMIRILRTLATSGGLSRES